MHQHHVPIGIQAGQLLVGQLENADVRIRHLGVHGEKAGVVVAEDVELPLHGGALFARLPQGNGALLHRHPVHRPPFHRLVVSEVYLAGEIDRRTFGASPPRRHHDGGEGAASDGAAQPIDDGLLGGERRVEGDVLEDSLSDDVELAAAQARLALQRRLPHRPAHLHLRIERSAGAPQVRSNSGYEGDVELLRIHVAAQFPVRQRRRTLLQQRSPAEVGGERHLSEEASTAWWRDADVQKRALPVALDMQIEIAHLIGGALEVADLQVALQPRGGRGTRQRNVPLQAAFRGRLIAAGEIGDAADQEPGEIERNGQRAVEEGIDERAVTAAPHQLNELGARELHVGVEPAQRVAVRLGSQVERQRAVERELRLERQSAHLAGGDAVAARGRGDLGGKRGPGEVDGQAHLAFRVVGKRARPGQALQRKLDHGHVHLHRPLQRRRQIRMVAHRASEIERCLARDAHRRFARERQRTVDRSLPLVENDARAHIDVPHARGADPARLDRERRARRGESAAGEQPRADGALQLLPLHPFQVQPRGDLPEVDAAQLHVRAHRGGGGQLGNSLHREVGVELQLRSSVCRADESVRGQPAAMEMRSRVSIQRQVGRAAQSTTPNLRLEIEIRP